MKKAIVIACAVIGTLALVGGAVTFIVKFNNKRPKVSMKLPEELENYAEKHIKFGGGNI